MPRSWSIVDAKRFVGEEVAKGPSKGRTKAGGGGAHKRYDGFGSATHARDAGHDAYAGPGRARSPDTGFRGTPSSLQTKRRMRITESQSHSASLWEGYDPDFPA
jgi:hypothetical protein